MFIVNLLAALISIYSILIILRIILSWFGGMVQGRFVEYLVYLTDPYLNWWRRTLNLRIGVIDFSAIAGIAALSIAQNILFTIARFEKITLGNILAIVLMSAWSIVSFIIGFFIIVIILRLIAYLTNRDIYSPFWQIIDSVSKPVLYRINRIVFGNSINNYMTGIIIAVIILIVLRIAGAILIPVIAGMLAGLPI